MTINDIVPGGVLTQDFGMTAYARTGAYGGGIHDGLDIGAPYGTRVNWLLPPSSVRSGFEAGGYGNFMVGVSGPWEILFGHLSALGNNAYAGLIGSTGNSTGNHTHLRVKLNGVTVNPYILLNSIGGNMVSQEEYNRVATDLQETRRELNRYLLMCFRLSGLTGAEYMGATHVRHQDIKKSVAENSFGTWRKTADKLGIQMTDAQIRTAMKDYENQSPALLINQAKPATVTKQSVIDYLQNNLPRE